MLATALLGNIVCKSSALPLQGDAVCRTLFRRAMHQVHKTQSPHRHTSAHGCHTQTKPTMYKCRSDDGQQSSAVQPYACTITTQIAWCGTDTNI
jgi:hypothetical protein